MLVQQLTGLGVLCFWIALFIRLPEVLRQREFRSMYAGVVTLGLSITLYYKPIALALAGAFGSSRPCNIGMNLWGVLTAGVIAALAAQEMWPRAMKTIYLLTGIVMLFIAVSGQTTSTRSVGCATSLDLPWWDPYWWVLCTVWIASTGSAVFLCLRSIRAASGIPALTATMFCFLIGFASSLLFWSGILGFLVFRFPWILEALPILLLFHIWSHTAGLFIGVVAWVGRTITALRVMRRRLRLLERLEKLEINSQVATNVAHTGLWRDFIQNPRLGLYRTEVQILDSLAILGDQTPSGAYAIDSAVSSIVAYYRSPAALGDDGEIVFEKLESRVREVYEGNDIRGDIQDRARRRVETSGDPGLH